MRCTLINVFMAATVFSGAVMAAEAPEWANFGGGSYHFTRANQNESNPGFGFEKRAGGFTLMAGTYLNSINQSSKYFAAEKTILTWRALGFGALAGFVDGYRLNDGGFIPAVAPTITVNGRKFGARIMYTPELEKQASAAISFQLRWRLN